MLSLQLELAVINKVCLLLLLGIGKLKENLIGKLLSFVGAS